MKVLNILWSFSPGGIGKCFLTYAALGNVDPNVEVKSVCIDILNREYDRSPLHEISARLISIKHSFDLSWIKRIAQIIRAEKPDVVFCHGFNGPVVILIEKLLYGFKIPMVCSYHGIYHGPTPAKKLIAPIYNRVQIVIYKYLAKRVITVENQSRQQLINQGIKSKKVFTVYNGIPKIYPLTEEFKLPGIGLNEVSIGLAARMDAIKGIKYLINAISVVIKRTNTPIKVYLVGAGPEYDSLNKKVQELSLEKVIRFVGYQRNIPQWLNAFDIFVLPSLSECHSIALIEAMRSGKAIIATNVGGNPESVRDGKEGLLVPAKDAEKLAEALIKMIESEELRIRMGKAARERFLAEFTEDIMMRNLVKALTLNS